MKKLKWDIARKASTLQRVCHPARLACFAVRRMIALEVLRSEALQSMNISSALFSSLRLFTSMPGNRSNGKAAQHLKVHNLRPKGSSTILLVTCNCALSENCKKATARPCCSKSFEALLQLFPRCFHHQKRPVAVRSSCATPWLAHSCSRLKSSCICQALESFGLLAYHAMLENGYQSWVQVKL